MAIAEETPTWADGLNEAQRRAVEHRDGPLLIAAGAGTGKTRTLVSRLARLLDDGVPPERVLLVTFSRRAASELTNRIGHLTDPVVARRVVAGTFHSVAHRILARFGTGLGLALVRRIVQAQGGSVGVQSTLGAGSVFHVILPRRVTP